MLFSITFWFCLQFYEMLCGHAAAGLTKNVSVTDLTKAIFSQRTLALTPNLHYKQSWN